MVNDHRFVSIEKGKLYPNEDQPRQYISAEVISSRRRQLENEGQLAPILVFDADKEGCYQIVDGECRWRAALESQSIDALSAEIYQGDRGDIASLLVTQLLRNDDGAAALTALEKAVSYRKLISQFEDDEQRGSALKQSADRLGMDYTVFTRALKVAEMSDGVAAFVLERGIDDQRVINGMMRVDRMGTEKRVDELFADIRLNDGRKDQGEQARNTREIVADACKEIKEGRTRQKGGPREKVKRKLSAKNIQISEQNGKFKLVIETPRELISFDIESDQVEQLHNESVRLMDVKT
ncbi:MAG: ParB N-terminal domain-containing protein [Gammaproteobacteria bacterium]|nr:ParB N-terminal domain-containing protein [Gammaproteobacteria bacterium]